MNAAGKDHKQDTNNQYSASFKPERDILQADRYLDIDPLSSAGVTDSATKLLAIKCHVPNCTGEE